MLRYFVAWNLWLAFAITLILGKGGARVAPTFYTVFGYGWVTPSVYWCAVAIALAATSICFVGWKRSSVA